MSGETVNETLVDDVTVSLFRDVILQKMVDVLISPGFTVTKRHPGIYQSDGILYFATQHVVIGQLDSDTHTILRVQSRDA